MATWKIISEKLNFPPPKIIDLGDGLSSSNTNSEKVNKTRSQFLEVIPKGGICAELGVQKGNHAVDMINIIGPSKLFLVDIDMSLAVNESDQTSLFSKKSIENNSWDFVELIESDSIKAADVFEDDFFDFIYVDGDHSYEGCLGDIQSWLPKLKTGGMMAGHDYQFNIDHSIKRVSELLEGKDYFMDSFVKHPLKHLEILQQHNRGFWFQGGVGQSVTTTLELEFNKGNSINLELYLETDNITIFSTGDTAVDCHRTMKFEFLFKK